MLPAPFARRLRTTAAALSCAAVFATGCDALAALRDPIESEHAKYVEGLREAGLADVPAGLTWIRAGDVALDGAAPAALPLRADGWFAKDSAAAVAWRFSAPHRRWLTVRATLAGASPGRLFVEAYRVPADPADPPVPLASAVADRAVLSFRVRGTDDLVVRLQPELLRGGTWTVEVTADDEGPAGPGTR